jgi:hypothetical protein
MKNMGGPSPFPRGFKQATEITWTVRHRAVHRAFWVENRANGDCPYLMEGRKALSINMGLSTFAGIWLLSDRQQLVRLGC